MAVKRVYDAPSSEDGLRVLVDRIWPRGLSRERARIDAWPRELAPSDPLRRWFGHRAERWEEFRRRYYQELEETGAIVALEALAERARSARVTLLFGARDVEHNNAVALAAFASGDLPPTG